MVAMSIITQSTCAKGLQCCMYIPGSFCQENISSILIYHANFFFCVKCISICRHLSTCTYYRPWPNLCGLPQNLKCVCSFGGVFCVISDLTSTFSVVALCNAGLQLSNKCVYLTNGVQRSRDKNFDS